VWAPLLEKAWAKVKGTYANADGGFNENGYRALLGAPMYRENLDSNTDDAKALELWGIMKAADQAGYLLSSGTGGGADTSKNVCNVANGHAYTIAALFEMEDSSGTTHKMLLNRNPWGVTYYTWDWNKDDPNWTDELVA